MLHLQIMYYISLLISSISGFSQSSAPFSHHQNITPPLESSTSATSCPKSNFTRHSLYHTYYHFHNCYTGNRSSSCLSKGLHYVHKRQINGLKVGQGASKLPSGKVGTSLIPGLSIFRDNRERILVMGRKSRS